MVTAVVTIISLMRKGAMFCQELLNGKYMKEV